MLRLASYDIVFAEVPGEVTLALNLSRCPNRCEGCHSPHLQGEVGEVLEEGLLRGLLDVYGGSVTCVAFMGGDGCVDEVARLAGVVRGCGLRTAWYSGCEVFPDVGAFDYVKLGAWVEAAGGLDNPGTNQRMYRVEGGRFVDITDMFRKV